MQHTLLKKLPLFKPLMRELETLMLERQQLMQRCQELEAQLTQCDYLPLPPLALRVRVGGWEDPDHFLGVGRKIFWDLKRLLNRANKNLHTFSTILDFGCGCGRVLRFFRPVPGQHIDGTDIDQESIQWCQTHLTSLAHFRTNTDFPPLEYPDEHFDFIYCISVFTHLPEEMQFQWLKELSRLLKPSGLFITSIHSEQLFPVTHPDEIAVLKQQGFYYLKNMITEGLPDYYQATFHTHDYIKKNWQEFFEILEIYPRGINNHQDAVVCRKKDET